MIGRHLYYPKLFLFQIGYYCLKLPGWE